ncbi:unnamed protein product [Camellia sinensis]
MAVTPPKIRNDRRYWPWFKMKVTPNCSCGAGLMLVIMARTEANNGCYFFRCPNWDNHRGSFFWIDDYDGGVQHLTPAQVPRIGGKWLFWVCCRCNAFLCFTIMILLLVLLFVVVLK